MRRSSTVNSQRDRGRQFQEFGIDSYGLVTQILGMLPRCRRGVGSRAAVEAGVFIIFKVEGRVDITGASNFEVLRCLTHLPSTLNTSNSTLVRN